MGQYSSYYLYQKYEKRGEQDWVPCYPNTFSISGDSTNPMPLVTKLENDPQCGYVDVIYRWINLDPSVVWICDGTTKYYKQQRQASYDNGATWLNLEEYQRGALIETQSSDCGEPIYEWRLVSGFLCDDCMATKLSVGVSADTFSMACDTATTLTSGDVVSLTAKSAVEWATIGNCVEEIGQSAFEGCDAMQFCRIPNSVKTIGVYAFRHCSGLTECSLPSGIETIGANAFQNCISLSFINLPNGITSLGDYVFDNCLNFRYINIPNSLTEIPRRCFSNCDGLTDIELPSSITYIDQEAFYDCNSMYSMTLHSITPPTLHYWALSHINPNIKIYVPSQSVEVYKTAEYWSNYANNIYPIQ